MRGTVAHLVPVADPDEVATIIAASKRAVGAAVESLHFPLVPGVAAAIAETDNAWRALEAEHGLLDAAAVSRMLGSRGRPGALANDRRSAGKLIGVRRRHQYLYPGFQFDAARGRTRPAIPALIAAADDAGLPHDELALWLCEPSGQLGGDRPVDRLDDADAVVTALSAHVGVQW
ncbi:hypothetical protein V6N00_08740 [Tersicoccus sp. MR15.9]|uniref:hypothetical protein n=1 Tax=Tersicoccus mangrovi TaxID=3121635 RepID=UPI002FE5696F